MGHVVTNQTGPPGKKRIALTSKLRLALEEKLGGSVRLQPGDLTSIYQIANYKRKHQRCWEARALWTPSWAGPDQYAEVLLWSKSTMGSLANTGVSLWRVGSKLEFEVL